MTQEDRELLLKDLCTRIPYEVKVQVFNYGVESVETLYQIDLDGYISTVEGDELKYSYKPYLFPLSSMTEEQKREFDISMDMGYAAAYNAEINCANRMIDFFHKNHLDYRGLIERGLALDATGLNIY